MSRAKNLLKTINNYSLTESLVELESESENTELDLALNVIEEYDLGYDCLKSSFNEGVEWATEFLNAIPDEDIIDEDFISDLVENDINEGSTALVKPKPYHNIFSKSMGNSYDAIMAGRIKGGTADVSTLELGTDKFYDKDKKHYLRLWKDAVYSKQPKKRYRQLVRALVNLVVNFKKSNPKLSAKAKSFLNTVTTASKPNNYYKSKEKLK